VVAAEILAELASRMELIAELPAELLAELPAELFTEVEASLVVYCLDSSVS
jgi:hypothetical protein